MMNSKKPYFELDVRSIAHYSKAFQIGYDEAFAALNNGNLWELPDCVFDIGTSDYDAHMFGMIKAREHWWALHAEWLIS